MIKIDVQKHVANVHTIPANPQIETQLKNIRPGQIAKFSGYLVEVRLNGSGNAWASSLSRDDGGNGACEIM